MASDLFFKIKRFIFLECIKKIKLERNLKQNKIKPKINQN